MLTKRGYYNILDNIFKTGGLSEDMEQDLDRLKSDYDEREGMLRRYGEVYDGEDKDEYEYREFESSDKTDWKSKYDDLQERYRKRFFDGSSRDTYEAGADVDLVDTPEDNKEELPDIDNILY